MIALVLAKASRDTGRAMSQENVEVVRRSLDAYARHGVEAVLPFLDREIVIVDPDLPGGGRFDGHDGFLAFVRQVLDSFEEYHVEPEEFLDAGEQVVVFLHHQGRGKESGALIELRDAWVWTVAEDRATRIDLYLDRADALEAAGLRE
jgi:ketosteroid isomerase-like protein